MHAHSHSRAHSPLSSRPYWCLRYHCILSRVQITLRGPSDLWFGVGFGASAMADLPYTLVVDGTGAVQERKLANHDQGAVLAPSVTVVSNTVHKRADTVERANHWGYPYHYSNGTTEADCEAQCDAQAT